MKNKPTLKGPITPLHGALTGDAPPLPPLTMFSNFFQLNAEYGVFLSRAVELFNGVSIGNQWRLGDNYLVCIYGFKERDLPTLKLHFLMHLAEFITRQDIWEMYSIHGAIDIQ